MLDMSSILWLIFCCFHHIRQGCPQATAHGDFSIYSCQMRHIFLQDFLYFEVFSKVNVVNFAVYSSKCVVYFKMCGQPCNIRSLTFMKCCHAYISFIDDVTIKILNILIPFTCKQCSCPAPLFGSP